MLTIMLACVHAFSKNDKFRPDLLYFGTFIIDITFVETVAKFAS